MLVQTMPARRSILLAAALAALLLVIGVSASAVWWSAKTSQQRVAALQSAHMNAGLALASIRVNVYLSAILTRDYLLDNDSSHAQQYFDQFSTIQHNTQKSFLTLEASGLDDAQKAALNHLRDELASYWDPTQVILDWSQEEKRAQRSEMLRQRVRRRQEIFALAEQVEQLVTANFGREREKITTADQEFRTSLGWTTGIALLLGLTIAGGTLARMSALERQSQRAESQLRLLSGQLRTTQEQERKYLSRELHDQVGQMLTGVRMELAGIARIHGDSEDEVSARIARAKGTVEQTLRICATSPCCSAPLCWMIWGSPRRCSGCLRRSRDRAVLKFIPISIRRWKGCPRLTGHVSIAPYKRRSQTLPVTPRRAMSTSH